MLYLKTFILFTIHYLLLILLVEVYARSLLQFTKLHPLIKNICTLLIYLLFALSVGCLFAFVNYFIPLRNYSDNIYFEIFYISLYGLSVIAAGLYFHKKYIKELQKYGYFK
jgi:glucan phosphoethanolaminetransferase (alkaline phosphatase superfamily)